METLTRKKARHWRRAKCWEENAARVAATASLGHLDPAGCGYSHTAPRQPAVSEATRSCRITAREISHFRREQHRFWPRDSGNSRRGGDMTKIVALTLVIGVLVAGSAMFAKNHPRALAACVTNCE